MLVLFIYITRLASKEIFSPSNEIHQEVDRAKDLSAPRVVTLELHREKLAFTVVHVGFVVN
jgi:hypothetical protein